MSSVSSPATSSTSPTSPPSAATTFQPARIINHETGSATSTVLPLVHNNVGSRRAPQLGRAAGALDRHLRPSSAATRDLRCAPVAVNPGPLGGWAGLAERPARISLAPPISCGWHPYPTARRKGRQDLFAAWLAENRLKLRCRSSAHCAVSIAETSKRH